MESMRWVGVDVHAKESLAAVLDPATGEISTQRISGRPGDAVVEWLATVPQPFRAVYEAGPTGYGLVRRARNQGLDVVVCAPGHILKNATDLWGTQIRQDGRLAIPDIAKAFSFGRSVGSDTSREPLAGIGRVGFTQRPASARANTRAEARRVSHRISPALT